MSDSGLFNNYVEALTALGAVESRQRDAVRRAVEAATSAEERVATQTAQQQRMYDRARKDIDDVEGQLAELREMLGQPQPARSASDQGTGNAPASLVEVRGRVRDIADWTTEAQSTVESLLRTRARQATAPTPVEPTPKPEPVANPMPPPPPARSRLGLIAVVAAIVVVIVVVVLITAR